MYYFKKDLFLSKALVGILFLTCFRSLLPIGSIGGISFLLVSAVFIVCFLSIAKDIEYRYSELIPFCLLLIVILFSIFQKQVDLNYSRYLLGLYYSFLFYFVYLVCRVSTITFESYLFVCKGYLYIFLIIVLYACFQALFFIPAPPEYPLAFLRDTASVYPHPVYLFASISLAFALSVSLYGFYKTKFYLFTSLFLFIAQFFTFSRKSLVAVCIVFFLYYIWDSKIGSRKLQRFLAISVVLLFLLPFLEPFLYRFTFLIDSYFSSGSHDPSARALLLSSAYDIAIESFPFGSGPGTFASAPAATHYSPLYYDYGLSSVFGLQPTSLLEGNVTYLMDSFWPHVLAEYGFIGLFLYVFILSNPIRIFWKYRCSNNKHIRLLSQVVIFTNLTIVLESFGGSYPSQLYFILVYSVLSSLSVSLFMKLRVINNE